MPQAGYRVVFLPFRDGKPTDEWQNFAEGFAGKTHPVTPCEARYRPVGMAMGPNGALYVSDSMKGRVWRIAYRVAPDEM